MFQKTKNFASSTESSEYVLGALEFEGGEAGTMAAASSTLGAARAMPGAELLVSVAARKIVDLPFEEVGPLQ